MKSKHGKIYIFRNSSFKDSLVKIGLTSRSSEQRAKEVSSSTGVPTEFEVLYEEDVLDCNLAESLIHRKLEDNRVNKKREFFCMPLKDAVRTVFEVCLEVNKEISASTASRLAIIIDAENMNKNNLEQIKEILDQHRGGPIVVSLIVNQKFCSAVVRLPECNKVHLSTDIINQLTKVQSVNDVVWVSSGS